MTNKHTHARRTGPGLRASSLTRRFVLLLLTLAPAGCGGDDAEGAPPGRRNGEGGRPPVQPLSVAVSPAFMGPIASYYTATASLEANNTAGILARVSGVVTELRCEEGDRVQRGQVLLRIEDDAYALRAREAEAEAARQRSRFERAERMLGGNFISQEEHETAANDLEVAKAQLELARLELSYTEVTSPFGGHIVRRDVDVGQNVTVGATLFGLADLDHLLAKVHVPSRAFRNISPGQSVSLVVDSTDEKLDGTIARVSPVIDATSGTIKVTVEVTTVPAGIRPGDFVAAHIVTERRTETLLVPRIAIIVDEGERVVYVAAADSTADRRVVEVGFEDDEHAEIIRGVEAGEQVVVQGQRSLRPDAPLRILDALRLGEDDDGVAS